MAYENSPVQINNLTVILSDDRWQDSDALPQLKVNIIPTSSHQDIAAIRYSFQDETSFHEFNISDDIINSIITQLNDDKRELIWDSFDPSHISLLNNLEKIMKEMSQYDVHCMANLYPKIFDLEIISCPNYSQWFIDVFLAQIGVYLATSDLIYRKIIQHNFPLHFTMPFDSMDGRMLTSYAMEYMRYPLRSLKILGSNFVRELEWFIIGFFNGWSDMYEKGAYIDKQHLTYELTHNMAESLLTEIDNRTTNLENIIRIGMHQNSSLKQELDAFRQQMKRTLTQINNVFSEISHDIDELKYGQTVSAPIISEKFVFDEPVQPKRIHFIDMVERPTSPPPNPARR